MQIVKQIDYHRNGICGLGFHVAIVEEDGEDGKREMLVVRFGDKSDDKLVGNVICAAFDLALLDKRNIKFFENSWRGDHYHEVIDKYLAKEEENEKPETE